MNYSFNRLSLTKKNEQDFGTILVLLNYFLIYKLI